MTTGARSELLPSVPTVAEFLPGFEAIQWYAIGAPRSTPADIIESLNQEVLAGLADPKMKARIADLGGEAMPLSPAQFGKFIADDTEKWAKVVKFAGTKAN